MKTLPEVFPDAERLFVDHDHGWPPVKPAPCEPNSLVEIAFPELLVQLIGQQREHAALVCGVIAGNIVDLPFGYRAHDVAVLAKENGPIHQSVDGAVLHGPADACIV